MWMLPNAESEPIAASGRKKTLLPLSSLAH